MKTELGDLAVREVLDLKSQQMLVVNSEYQRGAVWQRPQKKKLIDSVLRGYPIPLIYFHHIQQATAGYSSQRLEVIDGQQRINALHEFREGAFKLFDPVKDNAEARFPDFITREPCPWGGQGFPELSDELQQQFLNTPLRIVKIETNPNQARDLFVRLQSGMPLNSQEKRDAWPGQFTDFVLKLGGKPNVDRYPGHDFFNILMGAGGSKDRGKFRQLAAQIAMLFLTRHENGAWRNTNAGAIDDFYYEHLGFDADSGDAKRLGEVLGKLTTLLPNHQKRKKLIGHEAIHLVLLVDALLDDYTRSWESEFASAVDGFREQLAIARTTRNDSTPSEYWLQYGYLTRVNSDRADHIQRRHEFFATKMHERLPLKIKDPQRTFGTLEREIIYYRDRKRCGDCNADVPWSEAEIHHVDQHSQGGTTTLQNGALVHRQCHPKGAVAIKQFAAKWRQRRAAASGSGPSAEELEQPAKAITTSKTGQVRARNKYEKVIATFKNMDLTKDELLKETEDLGFLNKDTREFIDALFASE